MHRADAAELLLSLVTSRDRAAAIVGDLLEGSNGAAGFWWLVARTAVRQLGRDLATDPLGAARDAARALMVEIALGLLMAVALLVSLWAAGSVALVYFHRELPSWVYTVSGYGVYLLLVFQTGRWIARLWPRRAASVGVSLVVLPRIIGIAAPLVIWAAALTGMGMNVAISLSGFSLISWSGDVPRALSAAGWFLLLDSLSILAGAVFQRSKAYPDLRLLPRR
jgi:hypothetical protein